MRITIPHRYDFGRPGRDIELDLLRAEAWDAARDLEGPFGIPDTREAWERAVGGAEPRARARSVVGIARTLGARRICSYGVGAAGVELALARLAPELELVCTEYATRTLERLGRLFPEAEIVRHDLRYDAPMLADLHLLHRVDTELSNREWPGVLARFREPVLIVPSLVLGALDGAKALLRQIHPRAVRAGYLRNEAALRALWAETHTAQKTPVGSMPAFLLKRR